MPLIRKPPFTPRTLALLSCLLSAVARAEPGLTGASGLIAMPDARVDAEPALRAGLSHAAPYTTLWSSLAALPWLEVNGRLTRIAGVPGFPGSGYEASYGAYKDKTLDAKLRLADETEHLPALSLGVQDFLGTGIFRARYLAASKRVGELDLTLGVGDGRIDGVFAGLRHSPAALPKLSWALEYDATDPTRDHGAAQTGVDRRDKGVNLALEYRHGAFAMQLARAQGGWAVNAHARIPLEHDGFVAKHAEPEPYTRVEPRPDAAQWAADPEHRQRLARTLWQQEFRDLRIDYRDDVLRIALTSIRVSHMSRAVGRAARVALALAPLQTREIVITYTLRDQALASYTFVDLKRLDDYFAGLVTRRQLAATVRIEHAAPLAPEPDDAREHLLDALAEHRVAPRLAQDGGDLVALAAGDGFHRQLHVAPKLSLFVNDPSGAFRYDAHLLASQRRRVGRGQYLDGALRLTLSEDISQVTTRSNSRLPHVRSDVAEYKRGARLKLERLTYSHYWHPARRHYARASVGLYEEMFAGAGGQWLYLPERGDWAADVAVDAVRQRDTAGTGLRDYATVSALAGLHYRLPRHGLETTLRAGRFLARDLGARLEVRRRFRSGIELGGWYTVTDGNDITSPGAPGAPYRDKGLFLSIPMELVLPRDTQSVAHYALAPWTRDVGQMVASPGDLRALLRKPLLLDLRQRDGLHGFGDVDDDPHAPELAQPGDDWRAWGGLLRATGAGALAPLTSPRALAGLAGVALLAHPLDDAVARRARRHGAAGDDLRRLGDGVALTAWAGSGGLLLLGDDPRLTRTAASALQAGASGLVAATALRHALGRATPADGGDTTRFAWGSRGGFPDTRGTLAWATLTPYAREYDRPALYAVAGLVSAASVGGARHWLSDAAAGAALGYLIGNHAWLEQRRLLGGARPWTDGRHVGLSWPTP